MTNQTKNQGSIGQIVGTTMSAVLRVFTSRSSLENKHNRLQHKNKGGESTTFYQFEIRIRIGSNDRSPLSFFVFIICRIPMEAIAGLSCSSSHSECGEFPSFAFGFLVAKEYLFVRSVVRSFSPRIHDRLNQSPFRDKDGLAEKAMQEEPLGPFLQSYETGAFRVSLDRITKMVFLPIARGHFSMPDFAWPVPPFRVSVLKCIPGCCVFKNKCVCFSRINRARTK